ncbi:MAG: D-alanyl-D-alanine carboxypeptidase [Oscillospiraceae bacterium]|nr:D-alanyl-D-alanine carboxypeptidase [Oscillospiraceae bacterium]
MSRNIFSKSTSRAAHSVYTGKRHALRASGAWARVAAVLIVFAVVATSLPVGASAAGTQPAAPELISKGACVLDFETGIMLFGYEEGAHRVPASMTKLLTAYVIYDAVKAGEIKLADEAVISKKVSDFSYNREYSNVQLPEGSKVSIGKLLDVVLIMSACAAATALGEALCGSEEEFVARMNKKVAQFDTQACFFDAYGGSPDNMISPLGMARLSRGIIRDHPEILKITSQTSVTFGDRKYNSTNSLLGQYAGMDGLKTGFTNPAGCCFAGTAQRDGRRIIVVVMGAATGSGRFADSRKLLDYGFEVAAGAVIKYLEENMTAYGAGIIYALLANAGMLPAVRLSRDADTGVITATFYERDRNSGAASGEAAA